MMIGVDPAHEIKLTRIHEGLASGELLQIPNEKSVVIGKQLAQTLEVKVGDELIILSQGVDGSSANDLFTVKGILNLGSADLEEKFVLAPVGFVREFLSMPEDAFHTLLAKETFSPKLKEQYEVMSWEELLPDVNGPLLLFEKFLSILTMALTFVISIGVANTLYVSFNERQNEMESLNILGARPHWIIVSLFYEVVILLGLSLAIGIILGLGLNHIFHLYPADLSFLLGGTDFLLGGMKISPVVKVIHHQASYFKAVIVVGGFYMVASLYPLSNIARQIRR
jgi:ABC-type lipoprotein release transport system permease subunit